MVVRFGTASGQRQFARPAGAVDDHGKLTIGFDCLKASKRGTATLTLQHSNSLAANSWTSVQVPETSGTVNGVVFTIGPIDDRDLNQVQATVPALLLEAAERSLFA